jgi:hypothetical protein
MARRADLDSVATITEPEAAAIHHASQERVDNGACVLVYDLGGGTFDAAALRQVEAGWEIAGTPEGIEPLGGIDFDEAVFQHVSRAIAAEISLGDSEALETRSALARLRKECVDAEETLSADTSVSIPVLMPGLHTTVRLTREEFEQMIRPPLEASLGAVDRAVRSANVRPADLDRVLLVGGSSRIPLVAQLVGSMLDRPVAVDAHPKYSVALGAAIVAARAAQEDPVVVSPSPVIPTVAPPDAPTDVEVEVSAATRTRRRRAMATALVIGVVASAAALALVRDDGNREPARTAAAAQTSQTTAAESTTPSTVSTTTPPTTDPASIPPTTPLPKQQSTVPHIGYPSLWPFRSSEEVNAWRDDYGATRTDGTSEPPIRTSPSHATEAGLAPAANLHLVRYGTGKQAPWEAMGTADRTLKVETPSHGAVVGPTITVGGHITGVDESIHIMVLQPSSPAPIGDYCCVAAGGTASPWQHDVAVSAARDPALTIVAATGGHVQDVETFAITGVRTS